MWSGGNRWSGRAGGAKPAQSLARSRLTTLRGASAADPLQVQRAVILRITDTHESQDRSYRIGLFAEFPDSPPSAPFATRLF